MAQLDFLKNDKYFSVPVRDPVWNHIWLTPELREITLSEPFLRLFRIKQLGPAEYIYPGATHTRASHSFGVYHVALKMLRVLLERGAEDWTTEKGCCSFLAAALLHDLGHFPFTHSLKELPLEDHESLTARLLNQEPLKSLIINSGADIDITAKIVDKQRNCEGPDKTETLFFRHLLSGVLDPDKIDYLNRDAYFCGVPYGIQDTDYILSRIQPDRDRGLILDSRSIMSIESILFSKYLMYRTVYWHKQVRIATAMMKKSVYIALDRKLIKAENLYGLDDSTFYGLLDSLEYPEKELASSVKKQNFYQIICEFTFDPEDPEMIQLENLEGRWKAEQLLADFFSTVSTVRISPSAILIDIPERINFESDLFIYDEDKIFSNSSTVFSGSIVARFTSSLRILRIAVKPEYAAAFRGITSLCEKLAKCLKVRYN